MSPQVQKPTVEYDCKTDWWSIGIILYQLMYLTTPFDASDYEVKLTDDDKGKNAEE